MDTATIIAAGATALALLVVLAALWRLARQGRVHREELARVQEAAAAETAQLRRRLDELADGQERIRQHSAEAALLITDVSEARTRTDEVPDRAVVSATLGAPLIKVAAALHGLRRATSAEVRNRIGFEMRREVRRARKQRKRDMRAAWREARTSAQPDGQERAA